MSKRILMILLILLALLPLCARAQEDETDAVYRILDDSGAEIAQFSGQVEAGDEYIAGDNRHFRVAQVDTAALTARAEALGVFELPDVSWLSQDAHPVSAVRRAVALYCTHSDESYAPSDGAASIDKGGGIFDVAKELKENLEQAGVKVYFSDENHYPHDAGAYRRSRSTAASLAEEGVDALFDIHRDGIPDPKQYESTVKGEDVTKVRLLVGRSNQNAAVNKHFAAQIKAVADRLYPGLVKDIYIGKGTYNQDLMGQSVLMEFGTHTSKKAQVLASTGLMADVLNRTLYGGVSGAAGNDTQKKTEGSAWTSILWVIGIALLGGLVYAFAATGSGKAALAKWKGGFREMTGGWLGGRRKDNH